MKSSGGKDLAIRNGLLCQVLFTKIRNRHHLLNSQRFPIAVNKQRELHKFTFFLVCAGAENGTSTHSRGTFCIPLNSTLVMFGYLQM